MLAWTGRSAGRPGALKSSGEVRSIFVSLVDGEDGRLLGKKERREVLGYSTKMYKRYLVCWSCWREESVLLQQNGFVQMNHTNDATGLFCIARSWASKWYGVEASPSLIHKCQTGPDSLGKIHTPILDGLVQMCSLGKDAWTMRRHLKDAFEEKLKYHDSCCWSEKKKHPSISRMCHLSSVPLCGCHEQVGKPVWFPCLYICHLNLFLGPIEQIMARHVDVRTTMPCSNPCYNAGHENFRLKGPWTFCKRPLLAVLRAEALKFHTKSISKQPDNCPENTWCSLWKVLRGWCHSICSSFAATKTGGSASKIIKLLEG